MANNELGQTDRIEMMEMKMNKLIEMKMKEMREMTNKQFDQISASITELKATSGGIFGLCRIL